MVVHTKNATVAWFAMMNEKMVFKILYFDALALLTLKVWRDFFVFGKSLLVRILNLIFNIFFSKVMWHCLSGISSEYLIMWKSNHHCINKKKKHSDEMITHQVHFLSFQPSNEFIDRWNHSQIEKYERNSSV